MRIFPVLCLSAVVIVVGAESIGDPVQLLQREMQEMKRNYEDMRHKCEDMKQQLDFLSGITILFSHHILCFIS